MSTFEVRITEPTGARMLTPHVSNLSFRSVDPGGFGSVTFDLARAVDARSFADFAEIAVFDASTGEQVGGGRLQNPGRSMSSNGEVWNISAIGEGIAHAQERKNPYILIDSRLDPWYTGSSTSTARTWGTGSAPSDVNIAGLTFTISASSVGIGAYTNANMYDVRRYQQEIGGFVYTHIQGRNDARSRIQSTIRKTGTFGGSGAVDVFVDWFSTSERTRYAEKGTDWFTANDLWNIVYDRITSALNPVDTQKDWIVVTKAITLALRMDRYRNEITGGGNYAKGYVLQHEAIIDALARWCPRFDLINARIDTSSTYQHTSLVWPDGITTYDMFAQLMDLQPGYTWAVYEKQGNGLYRFEWRERDKNVRYELGESNTTSFELTGGQYDPLVRLWYTGTNNVNNYDAQSAEVDNPYAGMNIKPTDTRSVDLNNVGHRDWLADAAALAAAAVEDSQFAASSATVDVVGKVFDNFTGRWIDPFLVMPGYLCRVSGVRVQQDTLNTGYQPDAAVFRVVTNDYSVDSATSRLELNSYTLDESRAIATLSQGGKL